MARLRALTDGVVTLDEPRQVDAAAMVAAQDEGTRAAFGDDRPDTVEKAERWLEAARRLWAEQLDTFDGRWAIRSVGHAALIGWLSLSQAGDRANVRAWLGPAARGQQRGTRAVRLACDFAFSEIGVELIEAHIIPTNLPSRSLARSLGFTINPNRLTTSTDHTGMALVYELPRGAWPPAQEHATDAEIRRELASAEAELAAYDPADHFVATPPGRMGDLIRDHFHTKRKPCWRIGSSSQSGASAISSPRRRIAPMARAAYHPAPPVRDHKLELYELERLARTFDAIGDEIGGARYPAVAFVQWLADEYAATGRRPRREDSDAA